MNIDRMKALEERRNIDTLNFLEALTGTYTDNSDDIQPSRNDTLDMAIRTYNYIISITNTLEDIIQSYARLATAHELDAHRKDALDKINTVKQQHKDACDASKSLESELEKLTAETSTLEKKQKANEELIKECDELKSKNEAIKTQLESCNDKTLENLKNELRDAQADLDERRRKQEELSAEIRKTQEENAKVLEKVNALLSEKEQLEALLNVDIDEKKKEVDELKKQTAETQEEFNRLNDEAQENASKLEAWSEAWEYLDKSEVQNNNAPQVADNTSEVIDNIKNTKKEMNENLADAKEKINRFLRFFRTILKKGDATK